MKEISFQWSPNALEDLENIRAYISQFNPETALEIVERIIEKIEILSYFPEIAARGRKPGTRELFTDDFKYVIIYRYHPRKRMIHFLDVFGTAMNRDVKQLH
jgi:addiction module RelE/StbE family toxin